METNSDPPVDASVTISSSTNGGFDRRELERFIERGSKFWELPGTQQEPDFINKRIERARQPFTIFEIVKDQQRSLTGTNLTAAFVKLTDLTTHRSVRMELKRNDTLKEMILTAAENSSVLSDEEMAKVLCSLAQLEAEPQVEVIDAFMINFYSRMDQVNIKVLSIVLWALARLDYIPAKRVLIRACQSIAERIGLREGRLSDFSTCFWALAVMGYAPPKSILDDFVALGGGRLGCLGSSDVAQMLWSFIQFGFHPGTRFLSVIDALFCGTESMWSIEGACMLLWGMATYGYPINPLFIISVIDRVQSSTDASWTILVRTLSACARMCYHPGEQFMQMAANRLSRVTNEIYYEAIETVLWTCATFSFHPGWDLLIKLANKVEMQCQLFSPLHLTNIVWCYALFDVRTVQLWTIIIKAISRCRVDELPPEALYRLYQVYLLQSEDDAFDLPDDVKEAGRKLWHDQIEEMHDAPSPFYLDVRRQLHGLGLTVREHHPIGNQTMTIDFYLEGINRGLELLDQHEFTVNKLEHIGSAHMRTRLVLSSLAKSQDPPLPVDFLKYIDWHGMPSDDKKRDYLRKLLKLSH